MFTKINFENNEIKKVFKSIIREEKYLCDVIGYLEREYKEIVIISIFPSENRLEINLKCDNSSVSVNINFDKNQTLVVCNEWPYSLVFANSITRIGLPIGKLYQNNERLLMDKSIKYNNTIYDKMKAYDLITNNNTFGITINEYEKKLNKKALIEALLNEKNNTENINDIFNIINGVININDYEIKINTYGSKSDVIITNNGALTRYIYHRENDEYKEKIYLENNMFYREKTVKEKIDDDIPLIKRIGVRK